MFTFVVVSSIFCFHNFCNVHFTPKTFGNDEKRNTWRDGFTKKIKGDLLLMN